VAVTSGERVIEVHETASSGAKAAHEDLRAAGAVPESGFTGLARPFDLRLNIEARDLHAPARAAVDILNGRGERQTFAAAADGSVTVSVNGKEVRVQFVVGEPTSQVATHNYEEGANVVTVTISGQARPRDLARATAHELAEIATLIEQPMLNRAGVLKPGSKAGAVTELSAHDIGRKAELRVLLYELQTQPANRAEVMHELTESRRATCQDGVA
jgi:hypothetical protein